MGRYLELAMAVVNRPVSVDSAAVPVTGGGTFSPSPAGARITSGRTAMQGAPCGSPACAGCYDIGDGKKIHPPKCGPDYADLLKSWEPRGRKQ